MTAEQRKRVSDLTTFDLTPEEAEKPLLQVIEDRALDLPPDDRALIFAWLEETVYRNRVAMSELDPMTLIRSSSSGSTSRSTGLPEGAAVS